MLKAIVTVMDENDRILQANKLIYETNSRPVGLGIEHEFHFNVVTADEEMMRSAWKNCVDEIREEYKNGGTE